MSLEEHMCKIICSYKNACFTKPFPHGWHMIQHTCNFCAEILNRNVMYWWPSLDCPTLLGTFILFLQLLTFQVFCVERDRCNTFDAQVGDGPKDTIPVLEAKTTSCHIHQFLSPCWLTVSIHWSHCIEICNLDNGQWAMGNG